VTALLVLLGLGCGARGETLTTSQAADHVGKGATVCGHVASTKRDEHETYLDFGKPYPDQDFAVMIPGGSRVKFAQPPEAAYANRDLCVSGTIALSDQNKPQIEVTSPDQLRPK
jgi:hypothetical protein